MGRSWQQLVEYRHALHTSRSSTQNVVVATRGAEAENPHILGGGKQREGTHATERGDRDAEPAPRSAYLRFDPLGSTYSAARFSSQPRSTTCCRDECRSHSNPRAAHRRPLPHRQG